MYKRRKKLVRLDVQLRVVLIALMVACIVLLLNFHLSMSAIAATSARWATLGSTALVLDDLKDAVVRRFLLSIGILLPLAVGVGILYSFKFAGPIYRFKRFFTDLRDGSWKVRVSLRKGDDLQDLCEAINSALAPIQAFLDENRRVLVRTQGLLSRADAFLGEGMKDESRALRESLEGLLEVSRQRLAEAEEAAADQGTSPPRHGGEAMPSSEWMEETAILPR